MAKHSYAKLSWKNALLIKKCVEKDERVSNISATCAASGIFLENHNSAEF